MNVKRYFGRTAREALRRVKEELGADAIVLSNRSVDGGVEIAALAAAELPAAEAAPAPAVPRQERAEDYTVSLSAAAVPEVRPWRPQATTAPAEKKARPAPERAAAAAAGESQLPGDGGAAAQTRLLQELAGIKGLIEQQLAGFAWTALAREAPVKTLLLTDLLDAGFSAQLARRLVEGLPAGVSRTEGRSWLKGVLGRNLRLSEAAAEIVEGGGVYALVGPTGVGKTTTTAKLAARCVVRHGAGSVALVTTDGYRIGAHEQLRIYGRILGVPVHAVRDAAGLRQILDEVAGRHLVLIDTIGMSQRDPLVAEQAALLAAGQVRRLLLINATCRGDTLDDVVRAYGGEALAGAILTKVDEAAGLAPALDVLLRHRLELHYVSNGQRVPEDLHLPNRAYLLHRALREAPEQSPHRLQGEEAGLLFAAAAGGGRLQEAWRG